MGEPFPFRRVTVVGLARTGRAVVEALVPRGAELFLSELRALAPEERAFLEGHGVPWEEGGHTERALGADLLIPSPAVPPHSPLLQEARRRGVPVLSEIEIAFRLAQPARLIAVTGTNGKTTTTELVGAMLRAAGREPVVAGNIGRPAISTVDEVEGRPWVLEVSSYQLEWTAEFRPGVAVWLNFAPDHLDHHGSLAAYFAAKARLLARQTEDDWAVLPPDLLSRLVPKARAVDYTGIELPPGWGEGLPPHLRDDLRAAWAAAGCACPELWGSPPPYEGVAPALRGPHRMELVGEIGGIPFIDDSKGTNAHATAAALASLPGPVVLILGGRHKGGGYEDLLPLLRAKARACVLVGESQDYFASLLASAGVPHERAANPLEALRWAYQLAEPGDTVLLSPACASFDQFRDYAHRGEAYQEAFQLLSRER